MKIPHCSKKYCQSTEDLYPIRHRNGVPVLHICRKCNTEQKLQFRRTQAGKTAIKKAVETYESLNPKRKNAWIAVRKYPSKPCQKCGVNTTHKHHPDINRPLEVIFLCPLHHKQVHKELIVI